MEERRWKKGRKIENRGKKREGKKKTVFGQLNGFHELRVFSKKKWENSRAAC